MDHAHKIDMPLAHELEVSKTTQFLLQELECDSWYVACHHEHLFVYHLARRGVDRYAVSFRCTPPVEKGIYHGSKTWMFSIIPLHGVADLPEPKVAEIKKGLAELCQLT